MVQVSYPGVYVQEISSGVHTITGVATSVGAFVDSFSRGLMNEAVQCLSYSDFENEFGGLQADSEASYAIKQFFQNGGSQAWVVRVGTTTDADPLKNAAASAYAVTDTVGGAGAVVFQVQAGRRIRGGAALNPGAWGDNILVDVDYDTTDPATLFNLTFSEVQTLNGRRVTRRSEVFRNLAMDPALPNFALDVVNESSNLVQLDRTGLPALASPFPLPAATGTLGAAIAAAMPASPINLTIDAGAGARAVTVTYTGAPGFIGLRPLLEQAIRAAAALATTADERALLAGASVNILGNGSAASPFRYSVLAGRGGANYLPASMLTVSGAGAGALGFAGAVNDQQFELSGGQDGTVPVGAAALIGVKAAKTGIYALDDVDLFNILCIPRAADLSQTDMSAVYSEATTYCESRRAFLILDIPAPTASLDAMQTWLSQNDTLRSSYSAVYFPRTFVPDPLNGNRLRSIGASGTIAGLYARTDASRGVWKAPAGTEANLINVQGLAYTLTDLQNGALNPLAANCLRTFPVYGQICWGARTLDGSDQKASDWKYVPIRRLALFMEESLFRGTQWVVFEPNDEPLWAKIRLNVGVFMNGLFRQGAFQGSTRDEAFYVKCDKETTTQADRNAGIVNIEVGFAPLKPAEFVVLTIQQIAGDLQ